MARDVARGLAHLASCRVVHRHILALTLNPTPTLTYR